MSENFQATPKAADRKGESALERETAHIDKLMNSGSNQPKPQSNEEFEQGEKKLRVEQDNRVARVKREAEEGSQGRDEPEKGINPDG